MWMDGSYIETNGIVCLVCVEVFEAARLPRDRELSSQGQKQRMMVAKEVFVVEIGKLELGRLCTGFEKRANIRQLL